MKLKRFEIQNFKGIKKTVISLDESPSGNIVTLVGLNESGKTTILEALSYFITEDEATASLVKTIQVRQSPAELVHKTEIGIFTGKIVIEAIIDLEDNNVNTIVRRVRQLHGFEIDPSTVRRHVTAERRFTFDGGDLIEDKVYWLSSAKGKKKNGTKVYDVSAKNDLISIWRTMIGVIREGLPDLVYFPTFLFEFPERIYLREPTTWEEGSDRYTINAYYREILQDVADSLDKGISIEKHIVQRLEKIHEAGDNPLAFWAKVIAREEHNQVRGIVNLVAGEMGGVIFSAWNQIFQKPATNKRVQIDFGADPEVENIPFLQIGIFDGNSTYSLSQRSLGFRWFFSFLLFTQFRKSRADGGNTIFLFDEPASNLHATAQMRLLDGFANVASAGSYIIYLTHSHYMINPLWLEKAYIVRNKAIDYEQDDEIVALHHRDVEVEAIPYRQFVNANPTRISYFQPALDALRFNLGPMIPNRSAIIVEGKFDYYPIQYFAERFSSEKLPIFPINGAGDAGPLLGLMRGWGIKYSILLDDDGQGQKEKKRYIKDLSVDPSDIYTLADVDPSLAGKPFEGVYSKEVVELVKAKLGVVDPSKRDLSDLFSRLRMEDDLTSDLGSTADLAKKIVAFVENLAK